MGLTCVRQQGRPIREITVSTSEPRERDEFNLLVDIKIPDETDQFLLDRIIPTILKHVDHAVVAAIRARVRVGLSLLLVELPRFLKDKATLSVAMPRVGSSVASAAKVISFVSIKPTSKH